MRFDIEGEAAGDVDMRSLSDGSSEAFLLFTHAREEGLRRRLDNHNLHIASLLSAAMAATLGQVYTCA